jgi:hypothetical protein
MFVPADSLDLVASPIVGIAAADLVLSRVGREHAEESVATASAVTFSRLCRNLLTDSLDCSGRAAPA